MPVVNYHTVDGEIQGETTAGVRTDYLTDALGSVVATVNSSAQVVNTYRYKPYGERLAKTGVGADPKYGWTGDSGSRKTERAFAAQYNRARHYDSANGAWNSVDSLWPMEPSYVYALGAPVSYLDPSGTSVLPLLLLQRSHWNEFVRNDIYGCPCTYGTHPCVSDPCGYHPGIGGTARAWVVCCMESAYICVKPGGDPEVDDCIAKHEQYHVGNGSCRCKTYDRLRFDQPGDDSDFEECFGHLIEARCIRQKLLKKCGPMPPRSDRGEYVKWLKCGGTLALGLSDACENSKRVCKLSGHAQNWERICGQM